MGKNQETLPPSLFRDLKPVPSKPPSHTGASQASEVTHRCWAEEILQRSRVKMYEEPAEEES